MTSTSLWPLLVFVAVVAMIPLSLWLMRRAGLGGVAQGNLLRAVASLSLSPSQKVVVVELSVGDASRWLVLGVGGDHITALTTLDAPAGVPVSLSHPQAPVVTQLIERFRQGKPEDGRAS